jgi:acyl-CoA synthetase (AMP-forming)/AMP-acid ligase II
MPAPGVRWATYGGAPIAPALVRRITGQFPNARVGNGFGLTESTSISTLLPHEWAAEHAMMGEKVGAVIVPLPGAAADPQAVLAYAREHLADFKVPQFVAVRNDPLPRNPNGKVLKARLRDTDFGTPLF